MILVILFAGIAITLETTLHERRSSEVVGEVVEFVEDFLYGTNYLENLESWMTSEADLRHIDLEFTGTTTYGAESLDMLTSQLYKILILCPSDSVIGYSGENGFFSCLYVSSSQYYQFYVNENETVGEYTFDDLNSSAYENVILSYRTIYSSTSFGDWYHFSEPYYDQRLHRYYTSTISSSDEYVLTFYPTGISESYYSYISKQFFYNGVFLGVLLISREFEVVEEYLQNEIQESLEDDNSEVVYIIELESGNNYLVASSNESDVLIKEYFDQIKAIDSSNEKIQNGMECWETSGRPNAIDEKSDCEGLDLLESQVVDVSGMKLLVIFAVGSTVEESGESDITIIIIIIVLAVSLPSCLPSFCCCFLPIILISFLLPTCLSLLCCMAISLSPVIGIFTILVLYRQIIKASNKVNPGKSNKYRLPETSEGELEPRQIRTFEEEVLFMVGENKNEEKDMEMYFDGFEERINKRK